MGTKNLKKKCELDIGPEEGKDGLS